VHINDALIDPSTGAVIVPGCMCTWPPSHGNSPGLINEEITRLEILMDLTHAGLEARITGTLCGFSDDEARRMRTLFQRETEQHGMAYLDFQEQTFVQLMKPWSGFSIKVTVPWMWVLIRRSALARRMPISAMTEKPDGPTNQN
jgi:hypothetical protein